MQINLSNNKNDNVYADIFRSENQSVTLINKILAIILVISVSITVGFLAGTSGIGNSFSRFLNPTINPQTTIYTQEELQSILDPSAYDFVLYQQIVANLKTKYVDPSKVDEKQMFDSSLKGLVSGIGDPNTVYMNAEDYAKYKESFTGRFEGIGVRLSYEKNRIIVNDVFANSPADKAGVKKGYVFIEVDGVNVESDTLDDLVLKVRGKVGTKVKIKFYDPLSNSNIEKEIVRAAVTVESIRLKEVDSDTIMFEVARFTEATLDEWKSKWDAAVKEINNKGYKNVVLDLRGNLGGYLEAGIYAANDFLEPGKVIVTERTRNNGDRHIKSTNPSPRLRDKKVVILVNGGTASASEIIAGALKFHNKYPVVGVKTYGKGTVQETFSLPNKGALKITTEYWLLPDGTRLDSNNPIQPDIVVEQDPEKFKNGMDNQLEEALKEIKK